MEAQKPTANAAYSNSSNDNAGSEGARAADEQATRKMYEYSPYPDLGADLKSLDFYTRHLPQEFMKQDNLYLEAGCGTGHLLVNMGKSHPNWRCVGLDLSQASLDVAKQLTQKHDVPNVELHRGSYLDPLPVQEKFDMISAIGTVHHCADPLGAMKNLHGALKDDGYMLWHMYGWRCDHKKFDIKYMLDILEPDLSAYDSRFRYYRDLMDFRARQIVKRIAHTSLYDIYFALTSAWRNFKRKQKKVSWSPPWYDDYKEISSPWIDHFCHPCERAYEVPQIQELVEGAGFEVYKMIGQGRERPGHIPPAWRERYEELSEWDQYRLAELLGRGGTSFSMILRKKKS